MSGFSSSTSPLLNSRVLFKLLNANLNSTADQLFTQNGTFTNYVIDKIIATNASGSISLAAGGIYSTTSKGGTAIVAAAQVYSGLTGTTVVINPTIASAGLNLLNFTTLYLSLTTAMGSAGTCDIYITGTAIS